MTRTRAFIAAALATVYPGLGHVYLRTWFRALAWFGLSILTAAIVIPPELFTATEAGELGAIWEASRSLPEEAILAILAVRILNIVDAAWLGLRSGTASATPAGPTCRNCGRELDTDLDFCHWCTTPLEGAAEETTADSGFY